MSPIGVTRIGDILVELKVDGKFFLFFIKKGRAEKFIDFFANLRDPKDAIPRLYEIKEKFSLSGKDVDNIKKCIAKLLNEHRSDIPPEEKREVTYFDEAPESELLHPAGGIKDDFVYEPLGNWHYLWVTKDKRGVSKAAFDEEAESFTIDINGREYIFREKPLRVFPWHRLSKHDVKAYIDGTYQVKSGNEIYQMVKNYFESFGDYEEPWHSPVITLVVLESCLSEFLDSLFYLDVGSEGFGSGKTTLIEAIAGISYHGVLGGSVSPASQARLGKRWNPNWGLDEFDRAQDESDLSYLLARVGYRKNIPYIRWNPERDEEEMCESFAVRSYSYYDDVEPALKQRSLAHIVLSKSMDSRVPIINMIREKFEHKIATDLMFWRLEYLVKNLDSLKESRHVGNVDSLLLEGKEKVRETLFNEMTKNLSPMERKFLEVLKGRESELTFIAIQVSRAVSVNILKDILEALKVKVVEERSTDDPAFEEFRNLVKIEIMRGTKQTYLKNIIEELNEWCKERGLKPIKGRTIKRYYTELGFRMNKNIKRVSGGLFLTIDDKVKKRVEYLESEKISDEMLDKAMEIVGPPDVSCVNNVGKPYVGGVSKTLQQPSTSEELCFFCSEPIKEEVWSMSSRIGKYAETRKYTEKPCHEQCGYDFLYKLAEETGKHILKTAPTHPTQVFQTQLTQPTPPLKKPEIPSAEAIGAAFDEFKKTEAVTTPIQVPVLPQTAEPKLTPLHKEIKELILSFKYVWATKGFTLEQIMGIIGVRFGMKGEKALPSVLSHLTNNHILEKIAENKWKFVGVDIDVRKRD